MIKNAKRSKRFISLLVLSVMILSMGIPVAYAQSTPVSDIASHWAKNEISAWIEQGFITGYLDGTFKPDNPITRAEFIALVNRRFAFSEKGPVSFTDVKESDWFYAEFAKASKAGYLGGYQGTVGPNGFITRQEVASIAAKVKSLQEDAAGANGFADAAMIPAGSKGFIGAVTKAKIMNGYPDGKFEPAKGITRAESVITLNRLMGLKDSVKIEAIKDKATSVGAATTVAIKMSPADAKASIKNSDSSIVEATLSGANIQLKGLKIGTATITVTGKKDGLLDSVITFKVEVGAKVSSGGGGGGHHSGTSTNPPAPTPTPPPGPVEDDTKLTNVKAEGTVEFGTEVTGNYASDVTKVEVTYGTLTKEALYDNGKFTFAIYPGLAIGTNVTVKAYVGSVWKDTDIVKVTGAAAEPYISNLSADGTVEFGTEVTGHYASTVSKVEVLYNSLTKVADCVNGTFTFAIYPGLPAGTDVTIKAYVGTGVAQEITIKATGTSVEEHYLSNLKAEGTVEFGTAVTGNYANGVTKVEVMYGTLTKEADCVNGAFTFSIYPGLAAGTDVTIKAYNGTGVVEETTIKAISTSTEGPFLSNLDALHVIFSVYVSGSYVPTLIDKVEMVYENSAGVTTTDVLTLKPSSGTFEGSIYPVIAKGETVTFNAYDGSELKESKSVNVR